MPETLDAEQSVLVDPEPGSEGSARPKRLVDKTFRTYDQDQPMLLAPDLRDWLPADHPARWVDDLIEYGLDLAPFYDDYLVARGAPPYDPRLMLKLLIFGYSNGVTSSRELERRCQHEVDVAIAIADGAVSISDVQTLADQQGLHGPAGSVASTPTIWRVLAAVANTPGMLAQVRLARAQARDRAWLARGELTGTELPGSRAAGKLIRQVVIDLDATLVTAHSDKEGAKGNFKGGFGYHPLGAWLDNTGEALLSALLRPGNAGSNTAADHLIVLDWALTQLPDRWRSKPILVRADGAGYSHALISALSQQGLEFSVGYPVTEAVRDAIALIREHAWQATNNADGGLREHADVVDITQMLDLSRWTTTCPCRRVIVRRELPHPGATLDAFEVRDGYRYQAFTTNTRTGQLAFLEARHRAHARVEDRIRTGKDTGLGHLPSRHQNINEVWTELALIAADLLALAQTMLLTDQPELHRAEPKTLRHRLLNTAARITHGQRKVFLRLAEHWPWSLALAKAFTRLRQIPLPA